MRRTWRLSFLAATSVVLLVVLLCGYAATVGVAFCWFDGHERYAFRHVWVAVSRGSAVVAKNASDAPWRVLPKRGVRPIVEFRPPPQPSGPLLPWRFYAHTDPTTGGFMIFFPIWCAALPCTVAPALWLRRRSRDGGRGFAVEVTDDQREELAV